jgi:hypothetical protein
MRYSELQTVAAPDPGSLPSRAGETIAEVAFAVLVAGIWFLTCVAG